MLHEINNFKYFIFPVSNSTCNQVIRSGRSCSVLVLPGPAFTAPTNLWPSVCSRARLKTAPDCESFFFAILFYEKKNILS